MFNSRLKQLTRKSFLWFHTIIYKSVSLCIWRVKLRPYLWFIRNLFDWLGYRRVKTHWRYHGNRFVVELCWCAGTVPAFMGEAGQVLDLVLRTGNLPDLVWGRSALGVTPITAITAQPLSGWLDFSALCWSFTQVYYVNSRASRLQQKPRYNKGILGKRTVAIRYSEGM